jgi:hypothetical protein
MIGVGGMEGTAISTFTTDRRPIKIRDYAALKI